METIQDQNLKPMSVKDWVITLLIMAIPLVGFIMLFVYAFGSNENINKQNWAKAQLLVAAIVLGFVLLLFMIFGAFFASNFAGMQQY
ncbi:hypothetical protein [Flavobacterium sp. UBA6135]|uniref:hypothetical protein n=1 Tax=Flavobacterium sp. UBA6135 TaxID=1946553 RepID=UPI0025C0E03E|nr:hypothetical protein [Flavobacterium sp. UBA6135]